MLAGSADGAGANRSLVLAAFGSWLRLTEGRGLDGGLASHPLVAAALQGLQDSSTFDAAVEAVSGRRLLLDLLLLMPSACVCACGDAHVYRCSLPACCRQSCCRYRCCMQCLLGASGWQQHQLLLLCSPAPSPFLPVHL